jgi:catechol 2,3-dioxygenase-like lactoylglutathione lyase family enzyme
MAGVRFRHINVVAEDWESLARFYVDVFGCRIVPPVRDLSGPELDAATGLADAQIRGAHLHLPGCGDDGPTLEIFQYEPEGSRGEGAVNGGGFGHIAFEVDDVFRMRREVILHGGASLGDVVNLAVSGSGRITFVYMTDPEGNIIELQSWDE